MTGAADQTHEAEVTATVDHHALDRASLALGIATLLSCVFALTTGGAAPVDIANIRGPAVLVIAVAGLAAVVGAVIRRPPLVWGAGAALMAAAVLQLLQLGGGANWLGGNGSAVSLMGGLGLGLAAVGLTNAFLHTSREEGA